MDAKAEENRRIGGEAKQEKVARSRFCGEEIKSYRF